MIRIWRIDGRGRNSDMRGLGLSVLQILRLAQVPGLCVIFLIEQGNHLVKQPPLVVNDASAPAHYSGLGSNKVNATRHSTATRRRRSLPGLEVFAKSGKLVLFGMGLWR